MPQIQHPWYRYGDDALWKQKRWVWGDPDIKTKELDQSVEAQKVDLGQQRIEKYLGKDSKEELDKLVSLKSGELKNIVDNWNNNATTIRAGLNILTLGALNKGLDLAVDNRNKGAIDKQLTEIAKAQVKEKADALGGNDAKEYAENAFNILSSKTETASKLISNIDTEIGVLEKKLEAVNKANKGIFTLRSLASGARDFLGQPFNNENLRGRLARLKSMRATTSEIKSETEVKLGTKEKKNDQIREWDENLHALVAPYLEGEAMGEFEEKLQYAIVKDQGGDFRKYIDTLPCSITEKRAMKNLFGYLEGGNWKGTVIPTERISDWAGGVSKEDIKNYFQNKVVDTGLVNKKESKMIDKIRQLKKCKPGQEVKVGKQSYIMIRFEGNGFLLKEKGSENMAFMNNSNLEKPIFTVQKGKKFQQIELAAGEGTNSLSSIDFGVAKVVGETKAEEKDQEKAKEDAKDKAFFEKVVAAVTAAMKAVAPAASAPAAA
jgi:hypothetical protein